MAVVTEEGNKLLGKAGGSPAGKTRGQAKKAKVPKLARENTISGMTKEANWYLARVGGSPMGKTRSESRAAEGKSTHKKTAGAPASRGGKKATPAKKAAPKKATPKKKTAARKKRP